MNPCAFGLLGRNFLFPSQINTYIGVLCSLFRLPSGLCLEGDRGRQAGSLAWNGFGILGCSEHSPNRGSTDPGNSSSSWYPARDGERLAVMVQSR